MCALVRTGCVAIKGNYPAGKSPFCPGYTQCKCWREHVGWRRLYKKEMSSRRHGGSENIAAPLHASGAKETSRRQKVRDERTHAHALIVHTRTPPTPHRLINSNLISRGLTSYTRAFGGLVVKCCVSAGGEDRRRLRRCESELMWSASGLITPDWQLGVMAPCSCGQLRKPARGSRIQFGCLVFFNSGKFRTRPPQRPAAQPGYMTR